MVNLAFLLHQGFVAPAKGHAIEDSTLRLLIRAKLADGRLQQRAIPRVWGGPGNGETCAVCEEPISKEELEIVGQSGEDQTVYFHVHCFSAWSSERV